jgi:phosphoribosylformimino-5-aminoimidazole carboxamide ribotide isomerase
MIVVPAVDVRRGRVVRLLQGRAENETVYGADPAETAREWEAAGAQRLHLVDLDAALEGQQQLEAVGLVIEAVSIPVEIGGGLRTIEAARAYRDVGADRLIFGTVAVTDPAVVQEAVRRWPDAVAVAVDARDGLVTVKGWNEATSVSALDLVRRCAEWGVKRIQYTDVSRDGTLVGPNLETTEQVARACGLRITAAGGISVLEDLVKLLDLEAVGVDEVIVGKALYERRFSLAEAMATVAGAGGGH